MAQITSENGQRRLRLGMVGGGYGAYIGGIHRFAARLDDNFQLVAGAFDVDAEKGRRFALENFIDPDRAYSDFGAMLKSEKMREDRVDVVAICTPNHTHYPIAKACLEHGFHVICEKPLTTTLEDAVALHQLAEKTGLFLGVTYTYSGYPLVHEAREMVAAGLLGNIRVVQVEYPLEWMAKAVEAEGNLQAAWRTDPKRTGRGGCVGDIGTHAYHLAGFVTGLRVQAVCADLATFVAGRILDDNAHIMLKYEGGARGLLWASQVAIGCSNGLRLRVFGEKGGLSWYQENPNELIFTAIDQRSEVIKRGAAGLSQAALLRTRTPPGHPEGYIESFANLYSGFAMAIHTLNSGSKASELGRHIPTVYDGLKGVAFIEAAVDSSEKGASWVQPAYV